MRGNRRLYVRGAGLAAVTAPVLPVAGKFNLLTAMAFLGVLALLAVVIVPAIYSQKKARRDAAYAVLDRILPGRSTRERDLADVTRKAIDQYIERYQDDTMADQRKRQQ